MESDWRFNRWRYGIDFDSFVTGPVRLLARLRDEPDLAIGVSKYPDFNGKFWLSSYDISSGLAVLELVLGEVPATGFPYGYDVLPDH